MKRPNQSRHLYQTAAVDEVMGRLARLRPDSERLWGTMNAAQALAHCSASFEMALGEINPPRHLLGRLFGRLAKRSLIDKGEPMRRNSPTTERLVIAGERDFVAERERLRRLIERFVTSGPEGCTTHPHLFLGPLSPVEWATLMYQHLDHHLRQFAA
jgi:hypothetical protein